uniref:Uncharacterized protein n=1 Tax=viral metagenome TaxID=1070528 RepID=A0A6M3XUC8_9ZZZZ
MKIKTIWHWKNILKGIAIFIGGFFLLVLPIIWLFQPSFIISFIIGMIYGVISTLWITSKYDFWDFRVVYKVVYKEN